MENKQNDDNFHILLEAIKNGLVIGGGSPYFNPSTQDTETGRSPSLRSA